MAAPGETEAVVALIQRSFAQYARTLVPPSAALGVTADDIAQKMLAGRVLVGEEHGVLLGCVIVENKGAFAYAGRLAVDPVARRRGLGRALMLAAEGAARSWGHGRLRLDARLALVENRSFFRALGFAEGEQRCHPGFSTPTYVEMEKVLI